jgi:hypothetical protein
VPALPTGLTDPRPGRSADGVEVEATQELGVERDDDRRHRHQAGGGRRRHHHSGEHQHARGQGLRVGEFIALQADAVVLIGAVHWLHVPVGKLHEDRYLPFHPHLVTLVTDYRTAHVAADIHCCFPEKTAGRWIGTPSPG